MVMSVETQAGGGKWPSDLQFWVAAAGTRATGLTREGSRWLQSHCILTLIRSESCYYCYLSIESCYGYYHTSVMELCQPGI